MALEEGRDVVVEGRLDEAGDIVTVVVELPGNHEEEDGAIGSKGDEEAEALGTESLVDTTSPGGTLT